MKRKLNQEIIRYLNQQDDFITSEQIATELNVSKITVVRHISEINANYDKPVILSERGRGYRINLKSYFNPMSERVDNLGDERCHAIIKELLMASPKQLNVFDTYEKYYVSEAVIAKDRTKIAHILKKWDIRLVRNNHFFGVEGSEKNIRKAMMDSILNIHQMTDISVLEDYCNGLNNNQDFSFTMKQIEYASKVLGTTIVYPYNISLFAHIYILLERIRKYRYISKQEKEDIAFANKNFSPEIYSVCKEIIENISKYIGLKPDETEVMYLYDYLSSARISDDISVNVEKALASRVATSYIEKVSSNLQQQFPSQLKTELERHIGYLIPRLLNEVFLPNVLLNEIQSEYKKLHHCVLKASSDIAKAYSLPDISEAESGFISLYFAKYIELGRRQLNTYVVCTTGVGTSELIAVKIKQSLPEINIIGITSNLEISKVIDNHDTHVDLVITTIPMKQELDVPVVLVSSILTTRDVKTISSVAGDLLWRQTSF